MQQAEDRIHRIGQDSNQVIADIFTVANMP